MNVQPPAPTSDLKQWARDLYAYLIDQQKPTPTKAQLVFLQHKMVNDKATIDGLVMYDPQLGLPVFSKNGAWYKFDGTLA